MSPPDSWSLLCVMLWPRSVFKTTISVHGRNSKLVVVRSLEVSN